MIISQKTVKCDRCGHSWPLRDCDLQAHMAEYWTVCHISAEQQKGGWRHDIPDVYHLCSNCTDWLIRNVYICSD